MPSLNPIFILAILVALSVHEWAHGFVAHRLGDPTAKMNGRLTLNPLAHLDPLGTILFLTVGFGWGKPVPIDPRYFKHPKRDTALVSLAGPLSNLCLALLSMIALKLLPSGAMSDAPVLLQFLHGFFARSLFLNLGLMAFNLLPVAPLDGSKILGAFIPLRSEDHYEQFLRMGPWILLFLLLGENLFGFPLLRFWITTIVDAVLRVAGYVGAIS